jgi:hypothetical protein
VNGDPAIGTYDSSLNFISGISLMREVNFADPSRYLYISKNGDSWELRLGSLSRAQMLIDSSEDYIEYDFVK